MVSDMMKNSENWLRFDKVIADNTLDFYWDTVYRVAQNKIFHQTICSISATSGLILKILEAAQHFSESNGIQCIRCTLIIQPHYCVKQLLRKLQFSS